MNKPNTALRLERAPANAVRQRIVWAFLGGAALFLALDGLLVHAAGLTALVPLRWAMLAAGLLCLLLRAAAQKFGKGVYFAPAMLFLAALCAIFGGSLVRAGLAQARNALRDTLCAARGVLLPLADAENAGMGSLVLTGVLIGVLLALLCSFFAKKPRFAALFCVLCGALAAIFLVPSALWLTLCGACAAAFLCFGGADAARRLAAAGFCVLTAALVTVICVGLNMDALPAQTQAALHAARYESSALQPEGDPSRELTAADGRTILTVTAETPETLYLRGFIGDRYDGARWTELSSADAAAEKDLFYWLHRSGFDAQSQFALARACMGAAGESTVTIEVLDACRAYRYEPFSVTQAANGVSAARLAPSAVKTAGLRGERAYTYICVPGGAADISALLDFLQTDESAATQDYLQMESAYRDFVRTYALDVPEEFLARYCDLLSRCEGADSAPASVAAFLKAVFNSAPESAYDYAAIQTLALRYYGVPARYAEGVLVPASLLRAGAAVPVPDTCATAWAEVYQDGAGWLPVDLTPGFETLSGRGTQGGAAGGGANGTSGEQETAAPEGAEQKDEQPDTQPERLPQRERTSTILLTILLIAAILALFALALVLRRAYILRRRARTFAALSCTDAVSAMYAAAAALLARLGLSRGRGSMLPLCADASARFGADYGALLEQMTMVNARARFSSHGAQEDERQRMQALYDATLTQVKTHAGALRRLKMRWLECLY